MSIGKHFAGRLKTFSDFMRGNIRIAVFIASCFCLPWHTKKPPCFTEAFVAAERVGLIRYAHPFGVATLARAVRMPVGIVRTYFAGSHPAQMKQAILIV